MSPCRAKANAVPFVQLPPPGLLSPKPSLQQAAFTTRSIITLLLQGMHSNYVELTYCIFLLYDLKFKDETLLLSIADTQFKGKRSIIMALVTTP